MRGLLLLAHGSRRTASNREVEALARRLGGRLGGYDRVEAAFLELAEPSIETAIDGCAAAGVRELVLLPYFLAAGRHVVEDIPEIVAAKAEQYPQLQLRLLPYLGAGDALLEALVAQVEQGAQDSPGSISR